MHESSPVSDEPLLLHALLGRGIRRTVTVVKTVAAYEIVQSVFPRPVTEQDEVGLVIGRTIDGALSRYSHEFREGRKPTAASMDRLVDELLAEELADADLAPSPPEVERLRLQASGVLRAFRRSEVMGMRRPRSRLVLIDERVGYYAQPDYWNGRDRIYEMKSYLAVPPSPAVELQLRLFQLAFPDFRAFLACFDRRSVPVSTTIAEIPPLTKVGGEELLRTAERTARELGKEKVIEYVDNPIVRYSLPPQPASSP
jgi:hypothetical protein